MACSYSAQQSQRQFPKSQAVIGAVFMACIVVRILGSVDAGGIQRDAGGVGEDAGGYAKGCCKGMGEVRLVCHRGMGGVWKGCRRVAEGVP